MQIAVFINRAGFRIFKFRDGLSARSKLHFQAFARNQRNPLE